MGNDQRSGGSSSSSSQNKGKSTSNSPLDKPKQPQRGLGVAQLERIRLHQLGYGFIPQLPLAYQSPFPISPFFQDDMAVQAAYHQAALLSSASLFGYGPCPGSSSLHGYNPPNNSMIRIGEHMETPGSQSHPSEAVRCNSNNNIVGIPENQQSIQPQGLVTRHLLSNVESFQQNNSRKNLFESEGSSSHNSAPSIENENINLDLKLSL